MNSAHVSRLQQNNVVFCLQRSLTKREYISASASPKATTFLPFTRRATQRHTHRALCTQALPRTRCLPVSCCCPTPRASTYVLLAAAVLRTVQADVCGEGPLPTAFHSLCSSRRPATSATRRTWSASSRAPACSRTPTCTPSSSVSSQPSA